MTDTVAILRDLKDVVSSLKNILTTNFKPNDPDTQGKLMSIYTSSLKKYQTQLNTVEDAPDLKAVLDRIVSLFESSLVDEKYFFLKEDTQNELITQCGELVRQSERRAAAAAA